MTKTIDPITYNSLAGSEGTNLFKTNKIIPIIIKAIPVSKDTILLLDIHRGLYHLHNNKRKKFSYNFSWIFICLLRVICFRCAIAKEPLGSNCSKYHANIVVNWETLDFI